MDHQGGSTCARPPTATEGMDLMSAPTEPGAEQVEALAKVLGDIRVEQARQEDWWTNDEDHALLAQVLRGECAAWAPGVITSDWFAAQIAAARAEGAREAVKDHQRAVEMLREWRHDGLLWFALGHAIEQYAGPDDDTIPVLAAWRDRATALPDRGGAS